MHVRLSPIWTEQLRRLPESGMGYQLVDVELRDGRRFRRLPVLQAEELVLPDAVSADSQDIRHIKLHRG